MSDLPPRLGHDETDDTKIWNRSPGPAVCRSRTVRSVYHRSGDQGKRPRPTYIEGKFWSRIGQLWIETSLVDFPQCVEIGFFELPNMKSHAAIVAGLWRSGGSGGKMFLVLSDEHSRRPTQLSFFDSLPLRSCIHKK